MLPMVVKAQLFTVAALITVGTTAQAQREPLPAGIPADSMHRLKDVPVAPHVSADVDELLARLGVSRAEVARRKADSTVKPRPATPTPPPELERGHATLPVPNTAIAAPPPSPDVNELISKIRAMPGGQQAIDEAVRGGARIRPTAPPQDGESAEFRRTMRGGPFLDLESPPSNSVQATPFTLRMTPNAPSASIVVNASTYQGGITAYGAFTGSRYPATSTYWYMCGPGTWPTDPMWTPSGTGRNGIVMDIRVPTTGYYVVNFQAYGTKANLKHYENGAYPVVTTWDLTTTSGIQSYPALLYLAAGYHYFYWINESPRCTVFYEAKITAV